MKMNVECCPLSAARNFLQSPFWACFKGKFGWRSLTIRVTCPVGCYQFMVLLRRFVKVFYLAYVPLPDFDAVPAESRQEFLESLSREILPLLPLGTFMIRWDLPWPDGMMRPFRRAKASVQPPDTTILNLAHSQEELLVAMHKKTRYNIQLAAKKGVRVERAGLEDLPKWYKIFQQTAARDGLTIHSLKYYQDFLATAATTPGLEARLYLAWHEQDLLAGIITLFYQGEAIYVYGASASYKRNLMANYALQWQAICDAQAAGCMAYDFFGIPPTPDPEHPMAGLYRFKVGFGGALVHRCGAWDYAYSKVFYPLFALLEGRRVRKRNARKKVAK